MDDILSQIIAYAPDKIDTELKAAALVQGSRNMDQEPRNMYNQGSSVDHAVRTIDPVQDSGNKIEEVLKAYGRYQGNRKGKPMSFSKFFELYSAENFAEGGRIGFKKGLSAKQTNLFNSAKEFYKNTDANIKSDIRKNIITKATVGSRKKAAVLIKKENLINLTEMGDILDIKENIPAKRGTPTSGFRSKIVEAMTRKDSRLSPSKETFLNDYLIKKLKLQKINVGQGKPTYFIKKPNAAEIKDIKKYFIGKSGNFEPVVENRVRLFHSDPVLNKYAKKGLFLPQTTEMSEYLKKKGMTYNQAAYAQNKLTQIYNGGQNSNYLLKDIGINRVAANTFFRATANLPFNNPYRQLQYRDAMETITKEIGSDYFGKKGSMLNFKNKARLILKEAGIPIYDAKKGKKAFGINLNELTGVTAASRTGTSPYSQFFNLAEGKFNLGRYAQFNRTFEEFQNKLDNEINKGKKGNPNQIIKDYNIKRNSLLKEYDFLKENDVPKLSLKDPTEIYGKKRIAELKAQGLDLDENFKTKKYTIDVGKKTPTIKEFNIDPEVQKTQINNLNKDLLKLAGTKNKKCKGLLSYGGRVGLAEGLSPEFCINEGKKIARDLVAKNIKASPAQNLIMNRITSGVKNFAKSILDPNELFDFKKQFLSKGALIGAVGIDAIFAADDALRKDMDPKEAFAKTLFFGDIPSAAGFTDNVDVLNAKKMLENPNLSPAGKEYAQLIIDSTNLNKGQSDTGIVESFKTLTEGPTNQFKNLQELKNKVSNASTSGRFDYENALAEMQGTFKAKPKENKFFFDDAPDKPDVTPLTNKFATSAKSRGPMTEKKKQKVDYTPLTYQNYKPFSFTKEEFEDTMRQVGSLKEGQIYNDDFYKETIEAPMKALQFKEFMEVPGFKGTQNNFSEGGIASLNVKK